MIYFGFEDLPVVIVKKSTPYSKYLRTFATTQNERYGRGKFERARGKYKKGKGSFPMRYLLTLSSWLTNPRSN
jgi:hypothetical protein